jgi:hypothetical protein
LLKDAVVQAVMSGRVGGLDDFGDEDGHGEFDVKFYDIGKGSELDISDVRGGS